jgi:hypothetical protein
MLTSYPLPPYPYILTLTSLSLHLNSNDSSLVELCDKDIEEIGQQYFDSIPKIVHSRPSMHSAHELLVEDVGEVCIDTCVFVYSCVLIVLSDSILKIVHSRPSMHSVHELLVEDVGEVCIDVCVLHRYLCTCL